MQGAFVRNLSDRAFGRRSMPKGFTTTFVILVLALSTGATLAQTPEVTVFAVPDEGQGPLDVRIHVRASNVENNVLFCKLAYYGEDGPFEVENRFTLSPPYAERVFTHTYDARGEDYHPTVSCQDAGVASDSSPVTVRDSAANVSPAVELSVPSQPVDAAIPAQFEIRAEDPDGDTLNCEFDSGAFGETPTAFQIAPPYAPRQLQHKYDVARQYIPKIRCNDGRGGSDNATGLTSVVMSPGNQSPTFVLQRLTTRIGDAPHVVNFRVANIGDSNSDTLSCIFDPKNGDGPQPFTVQPPYSNVSLSATYTHEAELLFPLVSCVDGRGGFLDDTDFVTVHVPSGNVAPQAALNVTAETGASPLDVDFSVQVQDNNGESAHCVLNYGHQQGQEVFQVGSGGGTFAFSHTYSRADTYQVSLECDDGRGGERQETLWIEVDPVAPPSNYAPIVRLNATPGGGEADLPVSFFISGSDPDGDTVTCSLDFGDTAAPRDVVLEAPLYTTEWVPHTYRTASNVPFPARLSCEDGQGGFSTKTVEIVVDRPDSAARPQIQTFQVSTTNGRAPLAVEFQLEATDGDSRQLQCTVDYGDGTSEVVIALAPLSATVRHTYAAGEYVATAYCCDDVGFGEQCGPQNIGFDTATQSIVSEPEPQMTVDARASTLNAVPGTRIFVFVDAFDPVGQNLFCRVSWGAGEGFRRMPYPRPYVTRRRAHVYNTPGTFVVDVTCRNRQGTSASDQLVINIEAPGDD